MDSSNRIRCDQFVLSATSLFLTKRGCATPFLHVRKPNSSIVSRVQTSLDDLLLWAIFQSDFSVKILCKNFDSQIISIMLIYFREVRVKRKTNDKSNDYSYVHKSARVNC